MSASARYRNTLVAGATAVVIGTGFTAVGLGRLSDAGTTTTGSRVADSAPLAAGATPPAVEELVLDDAAASSVGPAGTVSPSRSAARSASPSAATSAALNSSAAESSTVAAQPAKPSRPAASTATVRALSQVTGVPETGGAVLDQVLAHINAARVAAGLSALALDTDLSKASARHNQRMIDGCGLSHQCAGEDTIGPRFTAEGVRWTSAGENIGFGSSGAGEADLIKAANGLTDNMLAEVPPNDGHRKNLLSTGFKRIGLSIVRDSKGTTWLTQDFVN